MDKIVSDKLWVYKWCIDLIKRSYKAVYDVINVWFQSVTAVIPFQRFILGKINTYFFAAMNMF